MSQVRLAEEARVSQSYISYIERGRRNSSFDLDKLDRISRALGLRSLHSLIREAEALDKAPGEIVENALAVARKWKSND